MKNLKLLLGIFALTLVFSFSSCEEVKDALSAPSWAQGKWRLLEVNLGELDDIANPVVITITKKELIPSDTFDKIPGLSKTDVGLSSDTWVMFGAYTVTKGDKANSIEIGIAGSDGVKLYK